MDARLRFAQRLKLETGWPTPSLRIDEEDLRVKLTAAQKAAKAAALLHAIRFQVYLPGLGPSPHLCFGGLSLVPEEAIPDPFVAPLPSEDSLESDSAHSLPLCLRRADYATELAATVALDLVVAAGLGLGLSLALDLTAKWESGLAGVPHWSGPTSDSPMPNPGESWLLSAIAGHLATIWLQETGGIPASTLNPAFQAMNQDAGKFSDDENGEAEDTESEGESCEEEEIAFGFDSGAGIAAGVDLAKRRLCTLQDTVLQLEREGSTPPLCPRLEVARFEHLHPKMLLVRHCKGPFVMHMIEGRTSKKAFLVALGRIIHHATTDAEAVILDPVDRPKKPLKRRNLPIFVSKASKADKATPKRGNVITIPKSASMDGSLGPPKPAEGSFRIEKLYPLPLYLTTKAFLDMVVTFDSEASPDVTTTFAKDWIHGTGAVHLRLGYKYNHRTKDHKAEVVLEQVVPPWGKSYEGPVNIRVVERGGPQEYEVKVKNLRHRWPFPCRSRHKSRPRKSNAQTAENATVQNVDLAAAFPSLEFRDDGSEVPIRTLAEDRNQHAVMWVQIDPDMLLIKEVIQRQSDPMLEMAMFELIPGYNSIDAVGQVNSIRALTDFPTVGVRPSEHVYGLSSILAMSDCVRGVRRNDAAWVRFEAAAALGRWQASHAPPRGDDAVTPRNWPALELLLRCYRERVCGEVDSKIGERPKAKRPRDKSPAQDEAKDDTSTTMAAGSVEEDLPWAPLPARLHSDVGRETRMGLYIALAQCRGRDDGYSPFLIYEILCSAVIRFGTGSRLSCAARVVHPACSVALLTVLPSSHTGMTPAGLRQTTRRSL
eukprot:scaffold7483_cov286-Pinguiococcus_pyrenoidosus.AAC.1